MAKVNRNLLQRIGLVGAAALTAGCFGGGGGGSNPTQVETRILSVPAPVQQYDSVVSSTPKANVKVITLGSRNAPTAPTSAQQTLNFNLPALSVQGDISKVAERTLYVDLDGSVYPVDASSVPANQSVTLVILYSPVPNTTVSQGAKVSGVSGSEVFSEAKPVNFAPVLSDSVTVFPVSPRYCDDVTINASFEDVNGDAMTKEVSFDNGTTWSVLGDSLGKQTPGTYNAYIRASDGKATSEIATITYIVAPNQAPVITLKDGITSFRGLEEAISALSLTAVDPDGGAVVVTANAETLTPDVNNNYAHVFGFPAYSTGLTDSGISYVLITATDADGGTASVPVTLTSLANETTAQALMNAYFQAKVDDGTLDYFGIDVSAYGLGPFDIITATTDLLNDYAVDYGADVEDFSKKKADWEAIGSGGSFSYEVITPKSKAELRQTLENKFGVVIPTTNG